MIRRALLAAVLVTAVCAVPAARRATAASASCPDANAPNTLQLVGGSPQTAPLHGGFEQPLEVTLANTNGCPVTTGAAGVSVAFSAPTSGASATFAASGGRSVVVGADSSGRASAQLTANGAAGYYTVVASSLFGSVSFSLRNSADGLPASIVASPQAAPTARAGTRYAQPLSVTVRDANGDPVDGATVTFSLGTGATFDGGGTQVTEQTGPDGVATTPLLTAGAVPGSFTATATVQGVTEPAKFALENLPAAPSRLTGLLPVAQRAVVGTRFPHVLTARLRAADGAPVVGATVTFALGGAQGAAGATFVGGSAQAAATTDASGRAVSPRLVANDVSGTFTATASANGAAVSYALRNLPGRPATISAGAAANDATRTGTRFPVRLAVTVDDAHGNPVAGALVTFAAPSAGPSGRFAPRRTRTARVRTDASGVAVAPPFVAGRSAGGYIVQAHVRGLARAAAFALVNRR
jgi:protocatechuate 3,4-dioxygenase beta subunit